MILCRPWSAGVVVGGYWSSGFGWGWSFCSMDRLMPTRVEFSEERLEFEVPEERIVASWTGPAGLEPRMSWRAFEKRSSNLWTFHLFAR